MTLPVFFLAAAIAFLASSDALAQAPCSGHKLLPAPRPERSCTNLVPEIYVSPDKAVHASVLAADVSLYATPDMESRVVIRTGTGDTLTSKDYSSPRGTNGYYVYSAKWSPDSQFFVFSMMSSGGHSPWSYPITVYSREKSLFASFSDMIEGKPTLSADFSFSGPHTLIASTWEHAGELDKKVAVRVDLDEALRKVSKSSD